jgi:V8-like Glu-specific endopeptidase
MMRNLRELLTGTDAILNEKPEEFKKKAEQLKKVDSPEELLALNNSEYLRKKLDELQNDPIVKERIIGRNNLMDLHYFRQGLKIAKTVCRLVRRPDPLGEKIAIGTGFMVGPGLLMTNNHVIRHIVDAREMFAEFEYEKLDGSEINTQTKLFKLDPATFFITRKSLDYAVIAVEPTAVNDPEKKLEEYGWNRLTPMKDKIFEGQFLTIVQHPRGLQKMIAFRDNQLISVKDHFLHYTTDTDSGSSGSLVANDEWEIIGLHHSGVPERDENDNILLTKGGFWQSSNDNPFIKWIANEGVLIDSILEDLEDQKMSISAFT